MPARNARSSTRSSAPSGTGDEGAVSADGEATPGGRELLPAVAGHALYHRAEVEPGVILVTGPGGRGMTCSPAIAEETFR